MNIIINQFFTTFAANDILEELQSYIKDFKILQFNNIYELIFAVFEFAYTFAGILTVVYLIYGGYLYLTSGGNEEKTKQGQKAVVNAIIGLVIVLAAAIILATIKSVLKIE